MDIIGVSGSPIAGSNTDRLMKHILKTSGLSSEFIKLSTINVNPCLACKKCAKDNICIQKDDFPALAQKLRSAKAFIIGGYTPYGMIDAFTKAFLERLWSMRHVNSLNEGKIVVTVISSLTAEVGIKALQGIRHEMKTEKTRHIGELQINGNLPCLTCGYGDECVNGTGIHMFFGPDAKASADFCTDVESQPVWHEAEILGQQIGDYLRGSLLSLPSVGNEAEQ